MVCKPPWEKEDVKQGAAADDYWERGGLASSSRRQRKGLRQGGRAGDVPAEPRAPAGAGVGPLGAPLVCQEPALLHCLPSSPHSDVFCWVVTNGARLRILGRSPTEVKCCVFPSPSHQEASAVSVSQCRLPWPSSGGSAGLPGGEAALVPLRAEQRAAGMCARTV